MTPCIESTRTPSQPYPQRHYHGKVVPESRAIWEEAKGPIPEGLFVCHHCDNKRCIRLDHLFLGTQKDNAQDASRKGRLYHQRLTHCPQGHPYDENNVQHIRRSDPRRGPERQCKACLLARKQLWRQRRRAQGLKVT